MTRTLIFGGARSGKSAYAEQLATATKKPVIYLATAEAGDAEMQARIVHHRERRPAHWRTVECTLDLASAVAELSTADNLIVLDCLTLWLSNCLFSDATEYPDIGPLIAPLQYARERDAFLLALDCLPGDIVMVSNEVGMGIVPQGALSRWFADESGWLNQAVAARCDKVILVAAGLPLHLKGG